MYSGGGGYSVLNWLTLATVLKVRPLRTVHTVTKLKTAKVSKSGYGNGRYFNYIK